MNYNIWFYRANCGDAARIRYIGNDEKPHNIFIDSGFEKTYKNILSREILELINNGELIDAWIITHIHDDHMGGVVKYIKEIIGNKIKDCSNYWYYNPPRKILSNIKIANKISSAISVRQADMLFEFISLNKKNSLSDISNITQQQDIYGLTITFLGPSSEKLNNLYSKYATEAIKYEAEESKSVSTSISSVGYDFYIPLDDFKLESIIEDSSIENGSSISFISEYNSHKVLWLADSHSSDIIKALRDMGFSETNQFVCDIVKISHHGSKGNNNTELYNLIKCCNYVFSVDAENKFYLPNKECLAKILRSPYRDIDQHYKIYFTYDNPTLRRIFKIDTDSIYLKWNFSIVYSNGDFIMF